MVFFGGLPKVVVNSGFLPPFRVECLLPLMDLVGNDRNTQNTAGHEMGLNISLGQIKHLMGKKYHGSLLEGFVSKKNLTKRCNKFGFLQPHHPCEIRWLGIRRIQAMGMKTFWGGEDT